MLLLENLAADYIRKTGSHIMYRVSPVFENENIVASAALMEWWSAEGKGEEICFRVFVYGVQPGIEINYSKGESHRME